MSEQERTLEVITNYYEVAEKGYWGNLGGRCHYGFTLEGHRGLFDMTTAQIEMERKLGNTLGLPAGSKVLDAGCGWSPVARTMEEEFGYDITGIDFIHRRLHMGKKLNKGLGFPRVDLANADYHQLPFKSNTFKGIYTMETIVHAYDLDKVLGEFFRILEPGGKIALFEYSIPDLDTVPKGARVIAERVIKNTGMASLPRMVHGEMSEILCNNGFENITSEDIGKNVYPSWFHLWKLSIKESLEEFKKGNVNLDSIPGSFWVWPARHFLGYNIHQASKPE